MSASATAVGDQHGLFVEDADCPAFEHSKVIYAPPDVMVTKRSWPKALPEAARFSEVFLDIAVEVSVPMSETMFLDDSWSEAEQAMTTNISGPVHWVLGHADLIQGHIRGGLLVQIDSDAEAGIIWGDGGILYFTVDDLDRLGDDFESVRAAFESS